MTKNIPRLVETSAAIEQCYKHKHLQHSNLSKCIA